MNFSKMNRLVLLILLLAMVTMLSLGAFLFASYVPGITASFPPEHEVKQFSRVEEPWAFSLDEFHASFPEGGYVAPAFVKEREKGALIWGEGEYSMPGETTPEKASGIFLVVCGDVLSEKKEATISPPVEDPTPEEARKIDKIKQVFHQQEGTPEINAAGITGMPLTYTPVEDSFYLTFVDEEGNAFFPVHNIQAVTPLLSGTLYALVFIILLLLLQIMSLNFPPPQRENSPILLNAEKPAAVTVIIFVAVTYYLADLLELSYHFHAAGYLLAIVFLLIMARFNFFPFPSFGINLANWKNGCILGAVTSFLFLALPLQVPQGIKEVSLLEPVFDFIIIFLSAGLFHELVWRGYIQEVLTRASGMVQGLIYTALLAGLVHFIFLYLSSPSLFNYPFIFVEIAVMVPFTALITGYLFIKTRNIFSCAVLNTLIILLPQYLQYH